MTPTVHLIEIYAYDICTSETITRPLPVSADPKKFWRQYHRIYDQTHYVAKEVRHALSIERPKTRKSVIAWLFREKERQLIAQAYRVQGTRGLLIKTLFQPGAGVSEFVNITADEVFFAGHAHRTDTEIPGACY